MYDTKNTIKSFLSWIWKAACRLPALFILFAKETIEGFVHIGAAIAVLAFIVGILFFVIVFGPTMLIIGGVIIGCIFVGCWLHETYKDWERTRKATDKFVETNQPRINQSIQDMKVAELSPIPVRVD
jgi:hypothetical protein